MNNLLDKNTLQNKSALPKQNRYLPIILWLFPLLLLNFSWLFSSIITYDWDKKEWEEKSKQEVELLSATSDFQYYVVKLCGKFIEAIKEGVKSYSYFKQNQNLIKEYITKQVNDKFEKPFPDYSLFVFKIPNNKQRTELIFSNEENIIGKSALGKSFEYLVKVHQFGNNYSEKESGAKYINRILGGNSDPSVMAETQKGKVSYSLYQFKSHYLVWDYFNDEKTNDIYGFILFIGNNREAEIAGRLLALRDLRNKQKNETKMQNYGAFIPIFAGYGGIITTEEFKKMPEYKKVTRKWIPKDFNELYNWEFKKTSDLFKDTRVGNYQAFFHLTTGQSHVAVLLKPLIDKPQMPTWLCFINVFTIIIISILLIMGFCLGIWPNTSLKTRFITTYFLAACMPLGLLIIVSYCYISEYKHSQIFKDQSQLRLCINQFEIRKTKNQGNYKTAFSEIKNDKRFQELIEEFDKVNQKPPEGFPEEAKAILDRATEIINKDNRNLPILGLTILDERGNYFTNYGNGKYRSFKFFDAKKEVTEPEKFPTKELRDKIDNDKSIEVFLYSFLQPMRNKIIEASGTRKWESECKPSWIQEIAMGGYKNARNSGSLTEEITNHRNLTISRLVGDKTISSIYDNIFIDGIPRFVIYMTWDVSSLDEQSFKSTLHYFAIKEPKFNFSAFKTDKGENGFKEPWAELNRHGKEFRDISANQAKLANLHKSISSEINKEKTVIAVPSMKYKDTIIVGSVSHQYLDAPVYYMKVTCISIIIFALLTLLGCIYFSSKIFLKPIGKLKQVLDKVADGNLDIEIECHSKDEFGTMCLEFSEMTKELSERNKLATLISDHAIEALSKHEAGNGIISDVETFKGTALVTDIRNFTGMCEKYNPEQITELLNEHFANMTKIFTKNGGRIYKYIGDAIEVVFSDNDDYEKSSVERAFIAAIEILNCLKTINLKRLKNNLFDYKIGVGLCYSNMSSGSIGSLDTRLDYAILGDALKNAAKLESFSKLNPDFPLIVDEHFTIALNKKIENIKFTFLSSEGDLKGFKIDDSCYDSLKYFENRIISNHNDEKIVDKNSNIEKTKTSLEKYDIEEPISFYEKLIPGLLFISIFTILIISGLFFIHKSETDGIIEESTAKNQRVLEQLNCDSYGRVAFDNKCRNFALALQNKINELKTKDKLSDENIKEALNNCYKSDKSIQGLELNKIFIKFPESSNFNIKDNNYAEYFEKLPVHPVANTGYDEEEVKKITNTYKIIYFLNHERRYKEIYKEQFKKQYMEQYKKEFEEKYEIEYTNKYGKEETEKKKNEYIDNNLDKKSKEAIKKIKDFLNKTYGEPCQEVFGEKITIYLLNSDLKNTSTESVFRKKDSLIFTLDYYKNYEGNSNKRIGYLIMSMPSENAYNNIPFILSSYSKYGERIILYDSDKNEPYFSDNIPEYIKENVNKINADNKPSTKSNKSSEINDYLLSISDRLPKGEIKIGNNLYDIYSISQKDNNNFIIIIKYFMVCIFIVLLLWVFWKVINGNSIINNSIPAKLWLTLLIVAVIPVLTVSFVSSLFCNEYLSVIKSQQRGEMQSFMGVFENKKEFSYPFIWNEIKNYNNSKVFQKHIDYLNDKKNSDASRTIELQNFREYLKKIIGNENKYSKEDDIKNKVKAIFSCDISDISICGKGGWSFCFSDKEDSIEDREFDLSMLEKGKNEKSNSLSYNEEQDTSQENYGFLLKLIIKSILTQRLEENQTSSGKINKNSLTNEMAFTASLDFVKAFFGNDAFVKISHGIDIPIIFKIGLGKFGIMISTYPNLKEPEAIIVWFVIIDTFEYLKRITKNIETGMDIYLSENYRYGIVANNTDDNNLRIPLAEFTSWMSSSYLPISTSIKLRNNNYIIEGAPALTQINAMLIFSSPEKNTINKVNNIALAFYSLLAFFLLLIIITTKNIADDIINPINALIYGIKEVNRENFAFRINSDRNDELGALCLSFDKMIKGLDEKHMISHMLSNTARMVTLNEDKVSSRKTDAVLLYIGIPDFSQLMFSLGDYQIFTLLKRHTDIIAKIILEEGGDIDKIIGEKMLAVFRVNNNKSKTALAAYRVVNRILELERQNKLSFPIAIGLNYGNVINGFLGVGNKRDFTVIGDPVNVAARIENLAESLDTNRCVISETFYKQVNDSIKVKEFGEVELKGKSKPMKVYQLQSPN